MAIIRPETEMKDSGVQWLGNVPKEWSVGKVKHEFYATKTIVGDKVNDYERLALTLNGVIKRSKDAGDGLQPEKFDGYQILKEHELVFKLIDLANVSTSRVGLSPYTGIVSPAYIVLHHRKDICALWIRRPLVLKINPIEWNDSFEVLYKDTKFQIQCANYSNQDILLHLKSGYIRIKIKENDKYEIHKIKEKYYTLKASSLTKVDIPIDTRTVDNRSRCKKRVFLDFEYNNGIWRRHIVYNQG